MSVSLLEAWLWILSGVVCASVVSINVRLGASSRGYLLKAMRVTSGEMAMSFGAQAVLAAFGSGVAGATTLHPATLFALGLSVAGAQTGADVALGHHITQKAMAGGYMKTILRFRYVIPRLRENINWLRQADLDALERGEGDWRVAGATPDEVQLRVRMVFECVKLEIANRRRSPQIMYTWGRQNQRALFYLLVQHLGREELRKRLSARPQSPMLGAWDGTERRAAHAGVPEDRASSNVKQAEKRVCDNAPLMERVAKGEAVAAWPSDPSADREAV